MSVKMSAAQQQVVADLIEVASDRVRHTWVGDCPDDGGELGTGVRDPGCPACRAILRAEEAIGVRP